MFTRTNRTEKAFSDWIELLGQTDQLADSTKEELIAYLIQTRHLMIVDVRNFFSDSMRRGDLDQSRPIAVLSRALPLIVLHIYETVAEAIGFCESAGMTFELHCYNDRFFKTTKQ